MSARQVDHCEEMRNLEYNLRLLTQRLSEAAQGREAARSALRVVTDAYHHELGHPGDVAGCGDWRCQRVMSVLSAGSDSETTR